MKKQYIIVLIYMVVIIGGLTIIFGGHKKKDESPVQTEQIEVEIPKEEKIEENIIEELKEEKTIQEEPVIEYNNISTISEETKNFKGMVTHYGPDCTGCSGITASGYDVRYTTTYIDSEFGEVRVIAAPREMPLYSVVKLHNYKGGEIIAIVLDRGGAIKGTHFDILVESESSATQWGVQRDVEFEILRWGK